MSIKTIRIPVSELYKLAEQMNEDRMTEVKISIIDAQLDQGHISPPFAHFEAFDSDGTAYDYGSVDSASD
ncbi:MAG: hypothetical protein GXX89_07245 [Clostridiales bacterium]|nr:hypothetical protein [Clostridiales bacterium]